MLKPRISNGYPELPAFKAKFKHVIAPSEENGLLDNLLIATYSFHSPDSFYYRAVPLFDFAGETATKIIKEAAAKSSSYGAFAGGFSEDNWEQGRVGVSVEKSHLYDRDRAARSYLDFFNQAVVGFEQIDEAARVVSLETEMGSSSSGLVEVWSMCLKGLRTPLQGV